MPRLATAGRIGALTMAERKAAQGGAPAYNYWFQWQSPILDGRARAFHCSELPFVFYNTERCATMTGNTPEARDLAARVSVAWLNFARKGDPNKPGLTAEVRCREDSHDGLRYEVRRGK